MSAESFAVTYDYRCPFARNAHEHLLAGLKAGAGWDVEFLPFSLTQAHIEEGATPAWEDPSKAQELVAIEAGLVVRDQWPERFDAVHLALFTARHDEGRDLRSEDVVRDVLKQSGVEAGPVFEALATGEPREAFRKAHESAVAEHSVFGVPTFIRGDSAVFVRVMTRPSGNGQSSIDTIERVLGLLENHPELNEFKHTTIPH
jgi:predicted DsbA family dithiol-disulfide isomerase